MYHLKTMSTQSLVRFIFLLLSFFSNSRLRSDKNTVLILNRPLFLGAGPQSSMCPGCTAKPKPTPYNFRSFDFQSVFFSQSLLWPVPVTREIFIGLKSKGHEAVLTALHHFLFQGRDIAADLKITRHDRNIYLLESLCVTTAGQ